VSWTKAQLDYEYLVTKQTRLGCFCGAEAPTFQQEHMAHMEAQVHVKRLTNVSPGLQKLIEFGESL